MKQRGDLPQRWRVFLYLHTFCRAPAIYRQAPASNSLITAVEIRILFSIFRLRPSDLAAAKGYGTGFTKTMALPSSSISVSITKYRRDGKLDLLVEFESSTETRCMIYGGGAGIDSKNPFCGDHSFFLAFLPPCQPSRAVPG